MKGNKGWVVVQELKDGSKWPLWATLRKLRRDAIANATNDFRPWSQMRRRGCKAVKVRLVEGWE